MSGPMNTSAITVAMMRGRHNLTERGFVGSPASPNIKRESDMITQILQIGQVVATPGAVEALKKARQTASHFLNRHLSGDWGDTLCDEDRQLNDEATKQGSRVLSAYNLTTGEKLWVITEADRSSTCLLLPSEY